MSRKLIITEQKYNTIVAQLKKNSGRKIAALHRLSEGTVSFINTSSSYENYRSNTASKKSAMKKLDKITQANPIKREEDIAPVSFLLNQVAKLNARVENLEDDNRQRLNAEFNMEAVQESRGWFHWLRKGN